MGVLPPASISALFGPAAARGASHDPPGAADAAQLRHAHSLDTIIDELEFAPDEAQRLRTLASQETGLDADVPGAVDSL